MVKARSVRAGAPAQRSGGRVRIVYGRSMQGGDKTLSTRCQMRTLRKERKRKLVLRAGELSALLSGSQRKVVDSGGGAGRRSGAGRRW